MEKVMNRYVFVREEETNHEVSVFVGSTQHQENFVCRIIMSDDPIFCFPSDPFLADVVTSFSELKEITVAYKKWKNGQFEQPKYGVYVG
jgi:hypothetical protein